MAFCSNCGASVEGQYCQKCGTPAAQAGSSERPPVFAASGIPHNVVSALCYLIPVVCPIIFLIVEPFKTDRKIRFDAFQSLLLTLSLIVINILLAIVFGILWQVGPLYAILRLAEVALVVFLAFKAFQREKVILPVIGPLADKKA